MLGSVPAAEDGGVQFWSGTENHCDIPGCLSADITLPGSLVETNVTIDYTYDGLREAPPKGATA